MKKLLTDKNKILGFTLLLSLFSVIANADTKYHKNELKVRTFDYKCHVNLVGGGGTVFFVNTSSTNLNDIANSLVGKNIKTAFSKKSSTVYKTIECVPLYSEFKSSESKRVDSRTVR